MKTRISFALLLCLVLMFATVSFAEDLPFERELSQSQINAITESLMDEHKLFPVQTEFRIKVDGKDLNANKNLKPEWKNILLMGTDTGNENLNYGRTDAMLVLSINKKTGEMKLSSLVRDMYVPIAGTNMHNRINAANAFGGPLLAVKTVNTVLDLNIEKYASINFSGFEKVVDTLGGVEIELTPSEAEIIGVSKQEGAQVLNGKQALTYVRIRKTDNNFGRNERQRTFLVSLLNKTKKSSVDVAIDSLSIALGQMATNLSVSDVLTLVPKVINNTGEMKLLSLPKKGDYRYARTSQGMSVVAFDAEKTKEAFHSFVYGE
ncbi:MAG: LCP family protein [Eubacteriales bacterium]|nr:LCP family protein [Eubacteriales bacterium]